MPWTTACSVPWCAACWLGCWAWDHWAGRPGCDGGLTPAALAAGGVAVLFGALRRRTNLPFAPPAGRVRPHGDGSGDRDARLIALRTAGGRDRRSGRLRHACAGGDRLALAARAVRLPVDRYCRCARAGAHNRLGLARLGERRRRCIVGGGDGGDRRGFAAWAPALFVPRPRRST